MITYISIYELLIFTTVTTMTSILIINDITYILLNIETVRSQIYPMEGPMSKATMDLCALVDIVRCLKSQTPVDIGR